MSLVQRGGLRDFSAQQRDIAFYRDLHPGHPLPHTLQAWAPSQLLGVPPRPAWAGSSKVEVVNRAHSWFTFPCLSLRRRGRRCGCCCYCYGCCLEKSKGRRGKKEKSPDQGAIVTMATVSAPAPLKLGEGMGLLYPLVSPTLTAISQFEAHNPELCQLEKASWYRAPAALYMGQCQFLNSWRAALKM